MVEILLGKEQELKLAAVPLSNSTVQRRISDMADDIRDQVVQQIKSAAFGLFSIQLDEPTDVASCSQLLVFARYVHAASFKEEFLFCSTLETTTRASDVFEKVSSFFESHGLLSNNVCGCCTNGAPAMLGSKSGFQAAVKKRAPEVKRVHCMIHRQALASKTLPASLQEVLDLTIQIVNFVKGGVLNTRLFKELCSDMDAGHQFLLFHTNVSRGNVTARVFELREELKVFFQEQGKTTYFAWLSEEAWILRLAYLVDMFEQLNKLNLQMQGRNTNIIKFIDSLKDFSCKLQNWKRKVKGGNVAMFEKLSSMLSGSYHDGKVPPFPRK
ncbi:SCAN domain-containing protein 3-like [Ornithodoros turicata]|uniref:SCAN domain-containing protein 3-like n=1 Tax=Ornithodoros turicata TaxID=34597 RepID=UPI0031388429